LTWGRWSIRTFTMKHRCTVLAGETNPLILISLPVLSDSYDGIIIHMKFNLALVTAQKGCLLYNLISSSCALIISLWLECQ
jgi:hypothetical protein